LEDVEKEICGYLGVPALRDYFRKPVGFFCRSLSRYSRSRRQAPIYWPLSTKSGSYTLWIYCHRLTEQTLHTALADFVALKVKAVRRDLERRVRMAARGTIGRTCRLRKELTDLRDEN